MGKYTSRILANEKIGLHIWRYTSQVLLQSRELLQMLLLFVLIIWI